MLGLIQRRLAVRKMALFEQRLIKVVLSVLRLQVSSVELFALFRRIWTSYLVPTIYFISLLTLLLFDIVAHHIDKLNRLLVLFLEPFSDFTGILNAVELTIHFGEAPRPITPILLALLFLLRFQN